MNNNSIAPLRRKRDRFANVLGVTFAFGIAFGGLILVRSLLEKEEEILLRSGGMIEVVMQASEAEKLPEFGEEAETGILTAEELAQIVQELEQGTDVYLHEPFQGQLSMSESIEYGKSWLEDFLLPHLGAEEYIPQEYKVSCYLMAFQGETEASVEKEALSYWMMTYEARDFAAELLLSAVTGQVLDASINCYFPIEYLEDGILTKLLGDYVDSFGLESEYVVVGTDNWGAEGSELIFQDVGNMGIYATIKADNIVVSLSSAGANEYREVFHIKLYLNYSIY